MANKARKALYNDQPSLFDENPIESPVKTRAMVHIGASHSGEASPLQKKFNAQARKVEGLRRGIDERTRAYNELLAYWGENLAPIEGKVADLQARLAFSLDGKAKAFKLGVRQRETVGGAILGLLRDSFNLSPPDEEAQGLFVRWNDERFDEELEEEDEDEMDEALREAIRGLFREDAAQNAQAEEERSRRNKTQKQLAKEERERQAEESARKSLRSLYLSLVKMFHPDAERDESAKAGKEKLMKEVTAAYEADDLHSLLRIEREWVGRESSDSGSLPEEKLKNYLSALKEQALELEDELQALALSPRFSPIRDFLLDDVVWGKHRIDAATREEKGRVKLLKDLLLEFAGKMEKQEFLAKVRELVGG
jgi:hypothetical protein